MPGGLALSADGKTLWVANVHGHSVARLDTSTGRFTSLIALEADSYPYGLAWDESRHRLYVSLWNRAAGRRGRHRDVQGRWPPSRPRSIPTSCCWPGAARSSMSPTPTATRSA